MDNMTTGAADKITTTNAVYNITVKKCHMSD